MKDLLEFLNNAGPEELTEVNGISGSLAEKIIAGRPYLKVEEALEVKGMGPNLLARMSDRFEEISAQSEEEIEEGKPNKLTIPNYDKPIEMYRAEEKPAKQSGGFWRGLFRFLLWVLGIAVVVAGIGAAWYYGLPFIQENFIDPLNMNTTQIRQIATQQAEAMDELNTQFAELDTRLTTVESQIETNSASIDQLEESLAELDALVAANQDALTLELRDQLAITYTLELINRARLYLNQSNFGMARDDVAAALEKLESLEGEFDELRQIEIDKATNRLELALSILPDYPVVAANDLEIAWYLLVEGRP